MKSRLIIVLVGLASAGKDSVAHNLEQIGFQHFSLSDTLRIILKKRGVQSNRDNLIRIANQLRKRYGTGYLAKKTVQRASVEQAPALVLSSIRNPGEIKELKKHGTVVIVSVDAKQSLRYKRAQKRGRIEDHVTFKDFVRQERFERTGSRTQQQLDRVMGMADYRLTNNGTRSELKQKVERLLKKIYHKEYKMNIVLIGPQGSGKGTQAAIVADCFDMVHVETGKIFRKLAHKHTSLGRKINTIINVKGSLVPNAIVVKALVSELRHVPTRRGLLFDGFPRSLSQARIMDDIMRKLKRELTHVIYLPLSRASTVKRLSRRRICQKCGSIYILGSDLKAGTKKCKRCGGSIIQREDDKPKAIARRLKVYNSQTRPIIAYYKKRGLVTVVDGEPSIPVVTKKLLSVLPPSLCD